MHRITTETSENIQKKIAWAVSELNKDKWNRSVMTSPSPNKTKLRIVLAKDGADALMAAGGLEGVRFADVMPESLDSIVVGLFPDASAGVPFDDPTGIAYSPDKDETLDELIVTIAKDIFAYLEDGVEPNDLTLG